VPVIGGWLAIERSLATLGLAGNALSNLVKKLETEAVQSDTRIS